MAVALDILIDCPDWDARGLPGLARTAIGATLRHLGLGDDWEVSLLACDDARIAALNAGFRGKAAATNVLSWPSAVRAAARDGAPPPPPDPADPFLGDMAIAHGICAREAAAAGIAFEAHVTHLLVHATLHLLGFDHTRPRDGDLMERHEVEILAGLGLPDPYRP